MQISKLIYHPFTVGLFTLIAMILCISLYINTAKIRRSGQSLTLLQKDLKKSSSDVKKAETDLAVAQNPMAKEEAVRDSLLMQKPGEYIVQVPDSATPSAAEQAIAPQLHPWQKWSQLLLGDGQETISLRDF